MTDIEIREDYPPNIKAIRKAIPGLTGNEIFAWDGIIYAPGLKGSPLPEYLIAHEQVHFQQQDGEPDAWWERYLQDEEFRLEQEIEAHRAEYAAFCEIQPNQIGRKQYLNHLAERLASKMYGRMIIKAEAKRRIVNE